jgi:D-alanyl-lipoteichoic acid acyltransferase DltB (MBOAT superfamily)
LGRYLQHRLGREGGRTAWFNFFIKPFGAASFAEFWRLWNPLYGYFLYYYSYRPLSRIMPRRVAVLVTFILCGFLLHDVPAWLAVRRVLPPGATIAFTLFGLGVVMSEALRMDLSRWPLAGRAAVNIAYLAGCVAVMLLIVRAIVSS